MTSLEETLSAIYRKDLTVLEGLVPASVNASDPDGRTPLMHAILAEDSDPRIVRLLIQRGADVDATDRAQKWTALHFAARDQNEAAVRMLLEAGATVDPVDVFGNTPLWRSVMNSSSDLGAINVLLKHGADPRRKNDRGRAPIDIARDTRRDDIIALLEGKG